MRIASYWLVALGFFLWLSPVTGVVLGMVYVHDWVARHQGFLLQDFALVTVLALGVGQLAAPVLLAAVFVALSLLVLPVALTVAAVFVLVRFVVRVLSLAGSLALDVAESLARMLTFPRCLYCGHHHEKAMLWRPPQRWRIVEGIQDRR